ncbi:hypothetical protein AT959_10700 [Dechloromonas denitrificans]|uniref:Peptide methionine sulfoxide reductase MsrA n=1 Tax=Dechloromonas denitrificans TaxID=281362 RepID=A0A133XJN6_9RHOO|nr:peptide-methionine (S)-S-oxide reductase MsrA [Dechloromonas denitrificans]KXB31149.1 hypothetical protein AT959_10700 [Dechloromonas denitrificans]
MAVAILGGGCFWCLEAVFEQLTGVERVVSGYIGGTQLDPTYEQVCSGLTGHAEVVRIEFDPAKISYAQLLDVFFAIHDPTTLNRQGADHGTQYRSSIFACSAEQLDIAQNLIKKLNAGAVFASPVVTTVQMAGAFFPAESYHQGYFRANPEQGYCAFVVAPKVAKAHAVFSRLLKAVDQ